MMDIERIGFWEEIKKETQTETQKAEQEKEALDDAVKNVTEIYNRRNS